MITTTTVPASERIGFIPTLVSLKNMMVFENAVYNFAGTACEDYSGGYWEFMRLSNGGGFMYPDSEGPFKVRIYSNYYEGSMSPVAFGIVATLFALSQTSFRDDEKAANHFHLLRDYAAEHPEAGEIFAAID